MQLYAPKRPGWTAFRAIVLVSSVFVSTAILATFFFFHNRASTELQLRKTLESLAGIAAIQFDGDELKEIQSTEDMDTEAYLHATEKLSRIKHMLADIQFVYIMRRTENPLELAFVADADAYNVTDAPDANDNGRIDPEEELSLPGDLYDISDVPALQHNAFVGPSTDKEFTTDQWGTFISAYAPIYDAEGAVVATLGIDMNASQFLEQAYSLFRPTVFLLVILLGLFLSSYIAVLIHQRRIEMLSTFDRERTALINLAMHQLGAPLAIFRWWLEILRERGECSSNKEHSEICAQLDEGVARMTEVMSALQDVSTFGNMPEKGTVGFVHVEEIARRVVQEFSARSRDKKMVLSVDAAKNLAEIRIDEKVVSGILRELISNAIDFSPRGSDVAVHIKNTKNGVQVDVIDHGCGIPKDELDRVFDRFTRASNASKYKPVGNGVGLFIVKRILDNIGGRIWIKSEVGKGTVLSFVLPNYKGK